MLYSCSLYNLGKTWRSLGSCPLYIEVLKADLEEADWYLIAIGWSHPGPRWQMADWRMICWGFSS